jgi:magnesium-transporting ATPase (P-type)
MGYSMLSVVVLLLVELPFYVLIASRYRVEAAIWSLAIVIGWGVIFGSIILLNLLAFLRITQMKRIQSILPNADNPESLGMQRMMTRIQITAGQIVLGALGALITSSFFQVRSRRGFYSDPRCYFDWNDFAFRISMFFVQYVCAVAIWFVAPSVRWNRRDAASNSATASEEKRCCWIRRTLPVGKDLSKDVPSNQRTAVENVLIET